MASKVTIAELLVEIGLDSKDAERAASRITRDLKKVEGAADGVKDSVDKTEKSFKRMEKASARAGKVARQDWRHSWTAMSFSSCWLQKLSIAVAKQTAFGALRRTTLCTRQRVLRGANASGDGDYESVTMGRAAAM